MDQLIQYIRCWSDQSGHILIIHSINSIQVSADFYPSMDSDPVNREFLGINALSTNMNGSFQKEGLQIELGKIGFGPTLELRCTVINKKTYLEPTVVMRMYDVAEQELYLYQ